MIFQVLVLSTAFLAFNAEPGVAGSEPVAAGATAPAAPAPEPTWVTPIEPTVVDPSAAANQAPGATSPALQADVAVAAAVPPPVVVAPVPTPPPPVPVNPPPPPKRGGRAMLIAGISVFAATY